MPGELYGDDALTSHSNGTLTVNQNIIGMSVVGSDYDQLKRFNLAEIYDPAPKPDPKEGPKESPNEGAAEAKS